MPNRLTDLEITEVSFVDRPAAPESRIELFKRDTSEEGEEFDLYKSLPSSEDVMEEEVLGSKMDRKKKKKEEDDDMDLEKGSKSEYSSGSGTDMEVGHMPEVEFDTPEQEAYVRSLEDKVMDAEEALEKADVTIAELQKSSDDDSSNEDEILKSADPEVVELVKAAQAEAEEAKEIAKAEREARVRRDTLAKAEEFGALAIEKNELADVLYEAGEVLPSETMEKLHEVLAAANEATAVSKLFEEVGKSGEGSSDAEDAIQKKADEIRKGDSSLTPEQAYDQALTENPELYAEALEGGGS